LEGILFQKGFSLVCDESITVVKLADKQPHDFWVTVNADVEIGWNLIPEYSTSPKMRLDIDAMPGNQIYQLRVAAKFTTWVTHTHIIVSADDDVKPLSRDPVWWLDWGDGVSAILDVRFGPR
jgi:hypothetical protein